MPEAYAKLIPELTNPIYKYSAEGAGEFTFYNIKYFSDKIERDVKIEGGVQIISRSLKFKLKHHTKNKN